MPSPSPPDRPERAAAPGAQGGGPAAAAPAAPELSVIVPVYNEEESIPELAAEIRAALDPPGIAYEVLWVDDGSTDGSPAALAALAAADPRVRVLRVGRNSGLSAALDAGFTHARAPVLVTLDGDLQNDPADIPRLLAELADCDVVCGVRARRRDDWLRRASSRIANAVRNRLTRESIADVGCTLRAYRAPFVARVPMFTGIHRFLPTLLRLSGARVKEVPVNHRPRLHGEPKYNIRNRIWRALVDLFAVRWMQRRWIDRRLVEEVPRWTPARSGSSSASPDRLSSSAASSSSGSPPSAGARATSRPRSGS
jgi:glycosyltransferase involved in cell wall biosynthesis